MNILIIDGQGGKLGRMLVERVLAVYPDAALTAVGTNTAATTSMLKAGARLAATGENAVLVAARKAQIILGPIGIVIADSMYGEITPQMALAVAQSAATRILIPFTHCDHLIAGTQGLTLTDMVEDAMQKLGQLLRLEA